jgi:hypothetical protein
MYHYTTQPGGQMPQESSAPAAVAPGSLIMEPSGRVYSISEPAATRIVRLLNWCLRIARRAPVWRCAP